jgi:hypothetical protein
MGLISDVNEVKAGYQDKDAAGLLNDYGSLRTFGSNSYIAGRSSAQTRFVAVSRQIVL